MKTICKKNRKTIMTKFKSQICLQIFALMGVAFLFVFSYSAMVGIIIAFKKYSISTGFMGIFTSPWVGLKHFKRFIGGIYFWELLRNTLVLSILKLIFAFPIPIILAIMLNEVRNQKFKKIVQTVSYLPHFISWVVVSGLLFAFLNTQNGVINNIIMAINPSKESISFLSEPGWYWPIAVISDIWKEMGWNAIIFLAAITAIDQEIYEAAAVDGAGRLQRIWHITLPGIKGTVVILLILAVGTLIGGGMTGSNFEQSLLLGNGINAHVSNIIPKYAFEQGLSAGRFSYATAVGLFQSVISLVLVMSSNYISKKVSGIGLF